MSDVSPSHEEVEKMAKKMSSQLAQIIDELLSRYNLSEL
jgi:hypothetical protein